MISRITSSIGKKGVLLLFFLCSLWTAPAQSSLSAQQTVALLRSLATEGRVALQNANALTEPRLFSARVQDGRTIMEFIADTLGTAAGGDPAQPNQPNHWALLDEAVSITLAEADRMKALAEAAAGTPAEARFLNARRLYLNGAARLLKYYKVAAGDVFDVTAGPLVGLPDLLDWLLPGEIQIRDVSGAGRFNARTRDFAGRLSGTLAIPGLGATLMMPNASFDTDGRFDISAYGGLTFPGGRLEIPARKPWHVRSTPERGLAMSGDVRLTLDNGLRFDGSVALADPMYCFGLAARGLEFDLGKSLLVRLPTLSLSQVNAFGDETRDAFADYFRNLNASLETVLTAVTNFPPISETQFGQPPEFTQPEITFDFSALNAWSAEIIANTRAGLVLAQQDLQPVLDSIHQLNQHARGATNALTDERKRLANLAARLELRRQMKEAADEAARQQAVTNNGDIAELNAQVVAGARAEGDLVTALVTPDVLDRVGEAFEIAGLLLHVEASLLTLGEPPTPFGNITNEPCAASTDPAANYLQRAQALALCAARREALRLGVNPANGEIITNIFNTRTQDELYRAIKLMSEMEATLTASAIDVHGDFVQFLAPLLNRHRERMLQELSEAPSLPRTFELASLISENVQTCIRAGVTVENQVIADTLEATMAARLQNVPTDVLDKANAEAQRNISRRRIQTRTDVDAVLGRTRDVGLIHAGDSYQPDPLTQLDQFFRVAGLPVPPVMGSTIDDYVRFKVAEFRARPFTMDFLTNRLGDAQNLLSTFIGLTDWADTRLNNDFAFLEDLRLSLTNFTVSLIGAAELQRAWWLIDRYQDAFRVHAAIYGETVNIGLRAAERQSRDAGLLASSRISSAFSNLVNNLVTQTDVLVPLPGNVKIDSISGRLCYDRSNGLLSGCFGGRLEFPDVGPNVFFEISQACLSTDGTYQIVASSAGPLPFGRMELTSSMEVNGSAAGVASFAGEGTLQIDTGSGFGAGPSVAVSVGYESDARTLSLGSTVTQLRLSDQIALLDGSANVAFSLAQPQGALELSGKLGLLAREPLATNRALIDSDFWLTIEALPTTFRYGENDFTAEFTGGSITLPPDLFRTDDTNNRVPVTVGITGRLCIRYDFVQNRLEFCGELGAPFTLALQNFVLELPELPGFSLAINSAQLELSGTQFPLLKSLAGTLALPLPGANANDPGQNRSGILTLSAQNWRIDGLPEAAAIAIGSDLRLADFNGFTFDVLTGSGLSFVSELAGGVRHTTFLLNGNLRAGFDQRVLTEDATGTAARFTVEGLFAWDMQSPPLFELNSLIFEGQFRLGQDGPLITGLNQGQLARLALLDLQNFFDQAPDRPFTISVEGALEIPGAIKFGLIDTKFIIDGSGLRFLPGGVQAELGNQTLDIVQEALPVYLSKAGLSFKNPGLPLAPAVGQQGLFDLANLVVTISGGVNLPNKTALDAGTPGLSGEVNNLAMSLRRDAQNNLVPEFSLNGLGVEIQNVDIPPLGALTGGLYVGNLNDAPNLYFAGTVGGKVNDAGAAVTMAIHRQKGFLGSCFELDVGPAGIPIDGGTLGGILLTGGKGGLSFGNQFADPCDFRSYIQLAMVNGVRQPVNDGTTDSFDPTGSPPPVQIPPSPPPTPPGPNSCILGDFPPATVNPLCEPHPNLPSRIIFKGTALSESQLNELGLTASAVPPTLNAAVAFGVGKIAKPVRDIRDALVGAVPPTVPLETRSFYTELLDKQIRQLENSASAVLANALGEALKQDPNASLYQAIVTAAAGGIPCLDATLKLQGNFSHAAVSTVLKGEGAVVVSTTGSALMQGAIKLIGIPIGEGTLAFSLTDSGGNINPSLGGVIHAGIGPLTLGDMSLAYQCDGCFDVVIEAFGVFLNANAQNLSADVKRLLVDMMNRSAPVAPTRALDGDPAIFFAQLTPRQQLGYLTGLFNVVDVIASGQSMEGVAPQTVGGFVTSFRNFVAEVAVQVDPRFCFQAKVKPTLFGFPMVPGATPLDARFAYERVHDETLGQDFQQLSANAVFAPMFVLNSLIMGPAAALIPNTDQANLAFSFRMPAFTPETVELAMNNPAQFAANQFISFVQDSTFTFGYAFVPLGIPMSEGQIRLVLPRLANHPSNPNRADGPWQLPSGQSVATREEVILAALVRARVQDPNWRGQRGELDDLFAPFNPPPTPGSAEERIANIAARLNLQQMAQLGFAEDYFPHGGMIGASRMQLPNVIAQAPPLDLIARVFDVSNPNWAQDAQQLFTQYLTANTVVGQMALYIPAANPPFGFDFSTNSAHGLIRAISEVDALEIIQRAAPAGIYPFDQLMFSGWMNSQLLGMPLGEASVLFDPGAGLLRAQAGVQQGSWLRQFIGASAQLEIRKPAFMNFTPGGATIEELYDAIPRGSVQERFSQRAALIGPGADAQFIADTIDLINRTMPKASMEVAAQIQIPTNLQSILRQQAGAALTFFAFSPAFDPSFGLNGAGTADDDNSPYAIAKRRGGLGLKGMFDLGLNLADANANNDIRISVPDASFSITPRADISAFPALAAQLKVAAINMPGLTLHEARLGFNSDPPVNGTYIDAGGVMDPLVFNNPLNGQTLLSIRNLADPDAPLSARFELLRPAAGPPLPGLSIDPSRIDMPMLGPGVVMKVHGATTNDPFSFSSTGPWNAQVSISGQLSVRDLFGGEVARIGAPSGQQFSAVLSGTGMELDLLAITLPTSISIVAFPGTPSEYTITLGSGGADNRLRISRDGTFIIEGGIGGTLPLNGLGFGSISAGANFRLDNTGLVIAISGNLNGGAINSLQNHTTIFAITGEFSARTSGVTLSGTATLTPIQLGVFRISGVTGENITASLGNAGFSIPNGARLRIQAQGYPAEDLFTLHAFGIAGNGDFIVSASNGDLDIPSYFSITEGTFTLMRSNLVASLDIEAPTVQLFPGKPFTSTFAPPLGHVFMDSTGRFYADSGVRPINLPGGFVARGRLEFGYEPDDRDAEITVSTNRINFGTITYGSTSNRVITVQNTGEAPLYVDIGSTSPNVFSVTPASLNLDANQSASVSVRFLPPASVGPTNGVLTFLHNAPGSPVSLTVTGTVRAIPILRLSSPAFDLGETKVNLPITRALRVDNLGLTNLTLTNRIVSGPFTVTPTNVVVPPLSNVLLQITFNPTAIANFNGSLEMRNNDSGGTRNVPLSGSGAVITWVDTRDGGEQWRAIAYSGAFPFGVAVTTNRVVFTDNRGHSWSEPAEPLVGDWRAAAMAVNSPTGWIAGSDGLFKRTGDGGRTWHNAPGLATKTDWRCIVEQLGLNRVVLAGRDALGNKVVAIERASGFDIETVSTSFGDPSALAWGVVGSQTIGLVGAVNNIYRSTNGGATWTFVANPPGIKVGLGINGSGVALAAAYQTFSAIDFNPPPPRAYIYRSLDAGATWTQVFAATGFVFNALSMEGNVAVAVGKTKGFNGTGVIYRSGDSGATWELQNIDTPGLFAAAIRFGETFVAGEQGDIHRRFQNPPSRGVLEFDPGTLHFGHVAFNDSVPRAITLRNAGISNIVVTNIVRLGASSNQFALGSTPFPIIIPPGGSESINVFFNPTNAGNVNGSLRFLANDPEGTFSAQLSGRSSTMGWVLKAPLTNGAGFTVADLQMLSRTVGYALNSRDLYKTTDGGATWRIINGPPGTMICMHWISTDEGYIGGGTFNQPPVIAGESFIYRTLNGGTNWTRVYSAADHPVDNIQVFSGGTGYAVTRENFRFLGGAGGVLKTTNDGVSWFSVTLPNSSFAGGALTAISSTEVFVGSGSILYRSINGGASWSPVLTNASSIQNADFAGTSIGMLVGNSGSAWRTLTGGDSAAEWTQATPFTTNHLGAIHATATTVAWAVPTFSAPEAQIFRTDDDGLTWRDELAESPLAGPANLRPTVVFGQSVITNSLALGTDGSVRRIEHFVNELEGLAVSQPVLDLGQSVVGFPKFTNFVLRNFGDRVLNVSNLLVDGVAGFNEGFRPTNAVPFNVPIGGSHAIGVIASNLVAGPNNATLAIVSDGALHTLVVELRNLVSPAPAVAAFVTDPPGLLLRVDGANVPTPAAYTMRDLPAAGEWAFGSLHTIEATPTQVLNNVTYTFAGWEPFQDRVFTNMATNIPVRYVASYVPTSQGQVAGAGLAFSQSIESIETIEAVSAPPAGLPTGPYLRLTQASISNALLGNFSVSGSVFLSAESIEATLASRTLRLPRDTSLPEVAELGAGSWRFSLSNQVLQLKAQTPSIELFNNVVNPPSVLTLGIHLTNTDFRAQFSLPQGVKIVPGLLEVGSSSISLTHTNFVGLNINGQVRALREPDGSDWAFRQNLNLQLRDGPFTIPLDLPTSVMRLTAPATGTEIVEIRGGAGSQFVVSRAANGVFSSSLTQVGLELLNKNVGTISAAVTSNGRVLFSSTAGSPFTLGPFQLETSGTNQFDWNIKNGSLTFKLPGGKLKATTIPGWPSGGLNLPPLDFDSNGDFEKTIDLNGFTFDNILLGHAPDAEDRYITFKRLNGILSLKIRDRQEYFGSFMRLGFDINSTGNVSGFFSGSFGADFGPGIGYVHFGSVSLTYDSTPVEPGYQFRGNMRVAGNDFRVKFGSAGAQACHLICGDDGCVQTLCLP